MSASVLRSRKATPYEAVALEYYDETLHPTCANFGELSARFLIPRVLEWLNTGRPTILEVGSGRSLVGPLMANKRQSVEHLTLLDLSPTMLEHSRKWMDSGARGVVADARETGLQAHHFDLIVSSLGDPYNVTAFWKEVCRLLRMNGECLFTCPSFEWASRFRPQSDSHDAEFALADGRTVDVPSFVPPIERQISMIEGAGLRVIEVVNLAPQEISGRRSRKLDVLGTVRAPAVRGIRAQRV